MWRRILWLPFWLCLVATAWGDIEVKPQYDANEPIVATVTITGVPEGAKLRGSFSVSDGSYLPAGENIYHIWAAPGKHLLSAQGVWVLTRDVTVEGQTFPVLLDFGQFKFERTIVVGGEVPPVPPPVPPPPPGNRKAVILEESKDKTAAQALLWAQLIKKYPPEKLQILDDDLPAAQQYVSLSKLTQRPVLLVLTEAGALIREVSVPSSVAAVEQEIGR
jgi:hypothetical protein